MIRESDNGKFRRLALSAILLFFLFILLLSGKQVFAAVLSPGTIATCGEIVTNGTYTLSGNVSTSTGPCFTITAGGSANQTVIDGAGHTITGNVIGDGSGVGTPGHNFTVQNVTVSGITSSNGIAIDVDTYYGNGGAGGSIVVTNSTTTSILVNGGTGGYGFSDQGGAGGSVTVSSSTFTSISSFGAGTQYSWGSGGGGGSIIVTNTNLNLSNVTITATGTNSTNGTLTLNYTTLNHTNLTLSALSNLTLNGPGNLPGNMGSYAGGVLTGAIPGDIISNISQCNLSLAGTYTLGASLTGNCNITGNGIILNGSGNKITGKIIGNGLTAGASGYNFTLQNITVTGTTSANGVNKTGSGNGGAGGSVTISSSTIATTTSNGGSSTGSGPNYGNGGNGGSIVITNSTTTSVQANGGSNGYVGGSGNGGSVTITNSTTTLIQATGAYNTYSFGAGNGGSVTVTGTTLNLSNVTISAAAGLFANKSTIPTNGTLTINYTTITNANLNLSALSNLTLNGPGNLPGSLGNFAGGILGTLPGSTITSISQCNLALAGTYTLGNDLTGNCDITANGVILNGARYTITGNVIGDGLTAGAPGSNFTLENMTVTGTTTSNGGSGANGGSITISSSTANKISSAGGSGGFGGTVSITNSSIDLTSMNLSMAGGSLTLNYTTLNHSGFVFPALSNLTLNGPGNLPGNLGAFYGGILSFPGDVITNALECNLAFAGTYTLGGDFTGNCNITGDGIILDGLGLYTVNGNVIGDGYNPGSNGHNFTLQNITVTGTTSANGVYIDSNTYYGNGGSGGSIVITDATTASISANGATGGNGITDHGGSGGSITISSSTFTDILSSGGITDSSYLGPGGSGGAIVVSGTNVDLSNANISALRGTNGADGTLTVNYSTLDNTNLILSALSNLTLNGPGNLPGNLGTFGGGLLTLLPGGTITNIIQCNLALAGTYTLGNNLTGNCDITGNGVVLNGAGYILSGNIVGDGTNDGDNGHDFTLQNITVTGTTSANGVDTNVYMSNGGSGGSITVSSSTLGVISSSGGVGNNFGYGGTGGHIVISTSTFTGIIADGGSDNYQPGGMGGFVTISNSSLNLSSLSISAKGGPGTIIINHTGYPTTATSGVLTLNYATLNHANLTLSALSDLILNGPGSLPGDSGSFVGGVLSIIPGETITSPSQCGLLALAGTYTLANDFSGDCTIIKDGVILNGAGHTITGNVVGDGINPGDNGHDFTLQNITVTGTTSANGADFNFSTLKGKAGGGGTVSIIDATTSNVTTDGGSKGATNGLGGTINVASSTTGLLQSNGGAGYSYYWSNGNNGGSITVTNSTTGGIQTNGGNGVNGYVAQGSSLVGSNGGSAGSVTIDDSVTDSVSSNGGSGISRGGNGGTISITNSLGIASSSVVSVNGGNATLCGYGGNGGSVNLVDSTYVTVLNNPGKDMTATITNGGSCPNPPSGSSGSSGGYQSSGQYTPPVPVQVPNPLPEVPVVPVKPAENPVVAPAAAQGQSSSGGFFNTVSNTASTSIAAVTENVKKSVVTLESLVPVAVKAVVTTANAVVNSQTSKAVQSTGFFTGLLASAIMYTDTGLATPWAASEIFLIPVKLWGLLLVGLGIRKKTRPWGTVYDSVTKQPIDPAFVTARDQSGKVVAEAITDIDGRYGFLLPDGTYYISAKKTNYEFPSKKMVGKSSDELYANLYFGEPVTIHTGEVLDKNIPLDQKDFDWNEYAKREHHATLFHSRHEKSMAIIGNYVYGIGLAISLIAVIVKQSTYNISVLIIYILVLALMKFGMKKKKLGHILDKTTNEPVPYAIIRVTTLDHQVTLRSGVCDANGRYYCIVPKGDYYVDIEKKNPDGSYAKIYESPQISSSSGIINKDFEV